MKNVVRPSKVQMEHYFEVMLSEVVRNGEIEKGIHWEIRDGRSLGLVVVVDSLYLTEHQIDLCMKAAYLMESKISGLETPVFCPIHAGSRERRRDGVTEFCSTVGASLLGYSCNGEKVEWK